MTIAPDNEPIIARNLEGLTTAVQLLHAQTSSVVIGIVGDEIIVNDVPVAKAETLGALTRRLQESGLERITIERDVTIDELATFIDAVSKVEPRPAEATDSPFPTLPHIRFGRVTVEQRVEGNLADMAAIRRLYGDSVSVAGKIWESAQTESKPDATMAKTMVDGLAQAVAQNRTALLALTTLKNYDNARRRTFRHSRPSWPSSIICASTARATRTASSAPRSTSARCSVGSPMCTMPCDRSASTSKPFRRIASSTC